MRMLTKKFFLFIILTIISYLEMFNCIFGCYISYCLPNDSDDVKIPNVVVRQVIQVMPPLLGSARDVVTLANLNATTKNVTMAAKSGAIYAMFGNIKLVEVANHVVSNRTCSDNISNQNTGSRIDTPSVIETANGWFSNYISNMSETQLIAACCAGFICLSVILFTMLTFWVVGREFANKAQSIMVKYPYLNKIFLFYLKWAELTSIPARIIFVCGFYINICLSIYYLSILTQLL